MRLLSSLVYSSAFMYNPYVVTRPYRHLTTKALIEPHHITCVSLDTIILIMRFGDRACMCRVDTPTSCQKWTHHTSAKVSWLFDNFFDNIVSDNGWIEPAYCKITNQWLFEGSRLTLLYSMDSFLIGHVEVRYSLLYYVLLVLPIVFM